MVQSINLLILLIKNETRQLVNCTKSFK